MEVEVRFGPYGFAVSTLQTADTMINVLTLTLVTCTRIQAILGYPLTCAKSLGIDTPILETLYVLMSALDARFSGRIQALVD